MSLTVIVRGATMVTLGVLALSRTADAVFTAMNAVALVVCLTALAEGVLLFRVTLHRSAWWLLLGETALGFAYGALTLSLPETFSVSPLRAIAAVDAWLLAATFFGSILALVVWNHRVARWTAIVWTLTNATLAIAGPANPPVAVAGLFVGGAFYTGVYGVLELVGGLWLDRLAHNPKGAIRSTTRPRETIQ